MSATSSTAPAPATHPDRRRSIAHGYQLAAADVQLRRHVGNYRHTGAIQRLLLTVADKRCSFGCTYCFADFQQYERPPSLEAVESGALPLDGIDVVYPACDVDLFAMRHRWRDVLDRVGKLGHSVSISTKAPLSEEQISHVASWSHRLAERGCVLKVGVSASTKRHCAQIEPRAASWAERLENLRLLARADIPRCLVLKPLLPDIGLSEYREMLADAAPFVRSVVIGDEYLDAGPRRRTPIGPMRETAETWRPVGWIPGTPVWPAHPAGSRLTQIAAEASALGMSAFTSDLDLMAALLREQAEALAA